MENNILGQEKISKLLLKFSVPCVTGLLISAFYNIVDQIFIGHSSLGYLGNAATGISFPVICIANAFAWCIGDGSAAYLSICAGRNDFEHSHKCIGTGLSSTFIISTLLAVFALSFKFPLMKLFGASSETLGLSVDYFTIIALFFPIYLMINVMNSMIRADGSPGYAMCAMIAGAVINIILDPIFIFSLDMGIKGAAIATVIGQTASFMVCAFYFLHPKSFKLSKESFIIDISMLKNLAKLGGATFISQISIVVMSLLSNISLSYFGMLSVYGSDIPISVFSIQTKIYTIVSNIVVGIALGGQPILGYNYGAKNTDRVREAYKIILMLTLSVGIISTLIYELFPHAIIDIFGGGNQLYTEFAVKTFRIYLSLSVVTLFIKASSIVFQATGKSKYAMVTAVLREMICLVVFTLSLSFYFESRQPGSGIMGVLIASPISDFISGVVVFILTVRFFRSLKDEKEQQSDLKISPTKPGIIVTIAREHGSMGKQIGKMVAERLNIPFYYKEMTALAAKESGLANEFISDINKNSPALFHALYLSTDVVRQAVIAQEKIITKIADEGECVIVGRAADYVLRNRKYVVKIFLHAPQDVRIKNIMEMYGDDFESAKANVIKSDKARSSYYKNISGNDWNNLDNYDLSIDTSIGKEEACRIILDFLKSKKAEIK